MRKPKEYTVVYMNVHSQGKSMDEIFGDLPNAFQDLLHDPVFEKTSKILTQNSNGNTLSNPSHVWSLPMSSGILQTA